MQNLLTTSLSNFQAELLLWLHLAIKNIKVDLDLSTLHIYDEYTIEFDSVGFEQCEDDTWLAYWRFQDVDEDQEPYLRRGETITHGQVQPSALAAITLTEMATYTMHLVFEWEHEKLENESETYQPCERHFRPHGCRCWKCRHTPHANAQHVANCYLCRSHGIKVRMPEDDNPPF